MAVKETIYIDAKCSYDLFLREKLRCEYNKEWHDLRPDFPPDLVLRDQEPPDIILRDEVLVDTFWGINFGEEIVVTPFPYAAWWRTGIVLNHGWYLRIINGEIVVSLTPLAEPKAFYLMEQANFILRMEGGEFIYEKKPDFSIILQDLGSPGDQWSMSFGEEIAITPAVGGIQEKTGITLAGGWEVQVRNGDIEVTQVGSSGPHLVNTGKEILDLSVIDGELVYRKRKSPGGQEFFNIAWALYFKEEITVLPWPYVTPMNGIFIEPTWVMQMKGGEIVLEQNIIPRLPFITKKPDRWKFQLNMVGQEMQYIPWFETRP